MIILAPISWVASIILPGWLSTLARVIFFLVLFLSAIVIIFEFKIHEYVSKIKKAVEYNFSLFLKETGLKESSLEQLFLIHQIERTFFKDYVKSLLETNVLFSSIDDIRLFNFRKAINFNLRLKVIYQDIIKLIESFNQKKYYNSSSQKYEYKKTERTVYSNDYEKALRCFNLSKNFSKEDLKKAYRKKIKEVHPDSGGSKERFLMVQKYFELLEKSV